jgi:hypothetical protein
LIRAIRTDDESPLPHTHILSEEQKQQGETITTIKDWNCRMKFEGDRSKESEHEETKHRMRAEEKS